MGKKRKHSRRSVRDSFQTKVLVAILIPVVVFCLITNIVISALLGKQLLNKREEIEREYLSVIYSFLDDIKGNLDTLALLAENSQNIKWIMEKSSLETVDDKKYAIRIQESLENSLDASSVNDYIKHMILVNRDGLQIAVTPTQELVRTEEIFTSPVFKQESTEKESRGKSMIGLAPSMIDDGEIRLIYIYPLNQKGNSYVYMEVKTDLFMDVLHPYEDSVNIVIHDEEEDYAWYSSAASKQAYEEQHATGRFQTNSMQYEPFGVSLKVLNENTLYSSDMGSVFYALIITVVLVICIGAIVSGLIATRITKPLQRLNSHISSLLEEDTITENPSIEEGEDEIAKLGKAFNSLVRHINQLMDEQKEMYEQKQALEITALQAQINPHFLYNTLDSVRWLAVFQKANNIADIVMSLENLLRNMAKGVGDKITLRDELSLTQDYINLQQVRYLEIFDYICDVPEKYMDYLIVKMTIQPLIENAILHGIEPTGMYGEITVSVHESEEDLYISVEDNGTGIDVEEFTAYAKANKSKNAMSGIGISNVDERLKMTYGEEYHLIYEGKKGEFTRITIHIPKETSQVCKENDRYSWEVEKDV